MCWHRKIIFWKLAQIGQKSVYILCTHQRNHAKRFFTSNPLSLLRNIPWLSSHQCLPVHMKESQAERNKHIRICLHRIRSVNGIPAIIQAGKNSYVLYSCDSPSMEQKSEFAFTVWEMYLTPRDTVQPILSWCWGSWAQNAGIWGCIVIVQCCCTKKPGTWGGEWRVSQWVHSLGTVSGLVLKAQEME